MLKQHYSKICNAFYYTEFDIIGGFYSKNNDTQQKLILKIYKIRTMSIKTEQYKTIVGVQRHKSF